MVIVKDKEKNIHLFSSKDQVYRQIEAMDIENGEYEFCDDVGRRLYAKITSPVTNLKSGMFKLITGEKDISLPWAFFSNGSELSQGTADISTLEELREYLTN